MAGTIVVDRIESDASYASKINVAGQITFSNTVNFGITSVIPVAGFYSPSTNNLAFTTASTERMRIDSSGNVGIGTASQIRSGKLSVSGDISNNGNINFGSIGNGRIFSDVNWGMILQADRASPASAEFMWQNAGGTERMRIDGSGNLFFNSGYGSSATAYGCRVWCYFNNSQAIVGSANISSITVNGTGDIRLNFTTAMPDANYSVVGSTNESGGTAKFCNVTQPATSNIRVVTFNLAGTKVNNEYNYVAVFR